MVTMMYTMVLFLIDSDTSIIVLDVKNFVELPAFVLSAVYLLDLVANVVVFGPIKAFTRRKFLLLEAILQLTYWTLFFVDIINSESNSKAGQFTRVNAVF